MGSAPGWAGCAWPVCQMNGFRNKGLKRSYSYTVAGQRIPSCPASHHQHTHSHTLTHCVPPTVHTCPLPCVCTHTEVPPRTHVCTRTPHRCLFTRVPTCTYMWEHTHARGHPNSVGGPHASPGWTLVFRCLLGTPSTPVAVSGGTRGSLLEPGLR